MENIEQIVPEEHNKQTKDSPKSAYIPASVDTSMSSISQGEKSNRWLESQLNSPKDFADRVKNLVDNTWPDEYA